MDPNPIRPSLDVRAVPARSAKTLIEAAARRGIATEVALRGTGLDLAALAQPGARITYRQHIGLHRNLVASALPDGFGFVHEPFSIASYGMLGYAMMSCATLGQAVQIAMKYYRTAGPLCAVSFEAGEHVAAIGASDVFQLGEDVLRLVIEGMFSTFPPLLQVLLGERATPVRVELAYERPRYAEVYETEFRCPVLFGRGSNRFCLDARLLERRLVQADADSALLFEQSCRELLADMERHASLANEVRHLLLSSPGKLLNAEEAAAHFSFGARTLRRRLAGEGITYQELVDEVRCRLAMDYLTTTTLSTQDIAELIGFSEATNFRRAFLRWTKRTPASVRRAGAPR